MSVTVTGQKRHLDLNSSTLTTTGNITAGGNIILGDGQYIHLGDNPDLKIYHNGSHSFIQDTGAGDLRLLGSTIRLQSTTEENMLVATPDGTVALYHDNSVRFETGAAGAQVTGSFYLFSGNYIHFDNGVTNNYAIRKTGTTLEFKTGGSYNFLTGNAAFAGTITGTTLIGTSLDINGNADISGSLTITGSILNNVENASLDIYGGNDTTNDAHIKLHGNANNYGSMELNYGYDATNSYFKVKQGSTENFVLQGGNATFAGINSITGGGSSSPTGVEGLHLMYDTNHAYIKSENNGTTNRPLTFTSSAYTFSAGNATFAGDVTVPKLKMGNTQLYPSGDNNHIHFIGTALIGTSTTASSNPKIGTSTYPFSQVHAGYFYGDGSNLSNVTADAPTNMVTTNTSQTITGQKTFQGNLILDDGSGETPILKFINGNDNTVQQYVDSSGDMILTRVGSGGAEFQFHTHASDYTNAELHVGGGIVTATKIGQWNTAYGWGNHASAGYAAASHTHAAGDITSGTLAVARGGTGLTSLSTLQNSYAFGNFATSSGDYDSFTRGLQRAQGGSNGPSGTSHATGFTLLQDDDNYGFQLFSTGSSDNSEGLKYRYKGTSYGNWQTIVTKTFGDSRYGKIASPTFTGTPAAPTASAGTNTTQLATTAFVTTAVSNLVDSAPGTLNTLNELAAALGDDASFSTTTATALGNRVRVDTASQGLNSTQKSNARTNIGAQAAGNYLTSFDITTQTDPKYLRSDADDTATGLIRIASSGEAEGKLIVGSSSQTSYALQQWQTSSHGTNNAYIIAYGASHGSQAGNFAIKNTLENKNIFFEVNSAVPLKLENGTSTFTGNIVVSGTVDGVDIAARDGVLTSTTTTANAALPKTGGTMTGDLVMQDEMINFAAGNPELPNFKGKRSSTRLNDRDWDTEGGWSYTTFENNTTDRPSDGLHNGNGLLTFNTHSGDGTNNYMHQIAMTTNTNKLWHRRRSGASWGSWEEIHKGDSLTTTANYFQLNTPSGYIQIGAMNTSHAHIYTDRPSFYTNKPILISGDTVLTSASGVMLSGNQTIAGNKTFSNDLIVNGITYGLYHAENAASTESGSSSNYYHDPYGGGRHLAMFLKNARADIIRYRAIADFQYWNGSSWVTDNNQLDNVKKLLDGRQDTSWYFGSTYYKFRFSIIPSTPWPTTAKVGTQTSWTGSTYPGHRMIVEEYDGSVWGTKVTAKFGGSSTTVETTDNNCDNWGWNFISTNQLHTGNGTSSSYNSGYNTRITIDFYGWSPSNASYTTVPMQNIFITSNFSGTENTDYTNLLDYDRNITTAGAINLGHASDTTIARSAAGKVTIEGNEIYHEGHKPTLAELGAQASGNYITGTGSLSAQDLTDIGNLSGTNTGDQVLPTDFVSAADGGTFAGSVNVHGNISLTGAATTSNQSRTIHFTGFDKEGTTDFSDAAYIRHTTNVGGHSGSVLQISSQNDSADGIAFTTNASAPLKWNSHEIWTAGNDGDGSGLDADKLDGQHASAFQAAGNYITGSGSLSSQNLTDIGNLSGTNTGDQDLSSFIAASTDTTISGRKTFSHADGLQILSGSQSNAIRLVTNNDGSQIADSFSGNTAKSYIYFDARSSSNDPGYIMHETSSSEANEGVLHLVPSDDNSTGDYVSIHGTNDPDVLKLHTSGLVETVNLQLQLKSGLNSIYLNDDVDIQGDLGVSGGGIILGGTGRIQGIDTVSVSTDAASKGYVDGLWNTNNLDNRYYTETESDARFLRGNANDTATGVLTFNGKTIHNDGVAIGDTADTTLTRHSSGHLQLPSNVRIFSDNYHPNADAWTTSRTLTIGSSGKSVSGSSNVSWSLSEIGAAAENQTISIGAVGDLNSASWAANTSLGGLYLKTQDGVSAGEYTNADVTVNSKGIITSISNGSSGTSVTYSSSGNRYGVTPFVGSDGVMEVGRYIDFHTSDGSTSDFAHRLTVNGSTLNFSGGIAGSSASFSSTVDMNATARFNFTSGTAGSQFEAASSSLQTFRCDSDRYRIYMGSERFTVTNTGRVGINDSTPDYTLDVSGNVSGISIYASHDIAAYSDKRVKKDIETIEDALQKVNKLRGVTFKRKDGLSDKVHMGVIAQEVQEVIPEVVSAKESDGHLSVSYGNMVGVLIEAVKELTKEVEELKKCKCENCNCK